MIATFQELNQHFIDRWWDSNTGFPDLGPLYTANAQAQNEKGLLRFLDQVEQILANPPRSRDQAQTAQARLSAAFKPFVEEALGIHGTQLDLLPSQAFSEASEDFVRRARAFDSRLSTDDLYQAGRNAWTAYGLQWLLGLPVQLTPSIMGYSLLYPYTDNYLDDPKIAREVKQAFNERFRQRLGGNTLTPVNAREQVIFELVGMIEKEYSRSAHPVVFESLLALHDAQGQSLNLLRRAAAPEEVLCVTFYKGGASVLADGYLAGGSLTTAQRQYTYGLGILAQLLDDIEDVEEDNRAGRLTLYSQLAGREPLDTLANRALHMGHSVMRDLGCFDVSEPVRELILQGTNLFFIEEMGRTDRYYSPSYLQKLEAHFPVRFSFLKEQRKKFIGRHGSLEKFIAFWLF